MPRQGTCTTTVTAIGSGGVTLVETADAFLSSPRVADPNSRRAHAGVVDRLAAEHGPHRQLAAVPATRWPQPCAARMPHQRRHGRIPDATPRLKRVSVRGSLNGPLSACRRKTITCPDHGHRRGHGNPARGDGDVPRGSAVAEFGKLDA